jgi:hypothetical protein
VSLSRDVGVVRELTRVPRRRSGAARRGTGAGPPAGGAPRLRLAVRPASVVRVCAGAPACRWCHSFARRGRLGRAAASEQQCRTAMGSPQGRRAPLFLQPQRPTAASALSSAQLIASRHRYGPLLALAFSLAELVSFGEPRVERRARMPRRRARPRALFTCPIRRKTPG